jgi:alkanesulfonate monooxygenase SsuD/methylene tetrahydromethanopterin reductase-like flavin-dependent oxidoreductase (luciferase family)
MHLAISIGSVTNANVQSMSSFVLRAEKLGVDYAWSYEAWGSDAITPLTYLAAKTDRIKLGCGVIQISARVPAMVAMTALS